MAVSESVVKAAQELGYAVMKPEQLNVAVAFVEGRDVFAVLPTGFGKSLCYACLPAAFDNISKKERGYSIVVVVTPLLAIMKDQVAAFSRKGLSSTYIAGDVADSMVLSGVSQGDYQLVFFTPEMILSKRWRRVIGGDVYAGRFKGLVIDEAHCVKKWGESFRRVLTRIGEVLSLLPPGVHVMALTGTAIRSDRVAVSRTIGLKNPYILTMSPTKPNLIYAVGLFRTIEETFKTFAEKLKLLKGGFPKTIIYGQTFGMCADIYLFLKDCLGSAFTNLEDAPDIPEFRLVDMFTSVTDSDHKSQILDLFKTDGNLRIVVATVAFGMGVDCPDIRQIVHIGLPDDICSYVQETGRAGRDGQASMVTLLQSRTYHHVDDDIKEYVSNTSECRRDTLIGDMDSYSRVDMGIKCLCCDVCAKSCLCGSCAANLQ